MAQRICESTGQAGINSAQLAFAFTFFNMTEVNQPVRGYKLDRPTLSKMVKFMYTQGTHFWREHGISLERAIDLSESLLSYNGSQLLTPEEISSRFRLSLTAGPHGIVVRPVEQWGLHSIREAAESSSYQAELWLPNNSLLTPDQLGAFEDLLQSEVAVESDWQWFFEQNPTFLYLLGDFEDYLPQVTLSPQVFLEGEEQSPALRPDFLLKRIGLEQWDILELKLPKTPLVVGRTARRRLSSGVMEAVAQLSTYTEFFHDRQNLKWIRSRLGLQLSSPRLYVLIGRDTSFRTVAEKTKFAESEGVKVFTFDDLYRIAKHKTIKGTI